jgi:hypothetical protein
MTYSTLVSLKLNSADGKIEREIVAHGSITVYNLHRVLQFCLTPSKSDATIAATVSVVEFFRNSWQRHGCLLGCC